MVKGLFIVLEGIDGCGKSTQIKGLANYVFDLDKSKHVFLTREPTKISKYGEQVRKLLANKKDPKKDSEFFTKLYVKDRWFHVKNHILPMINARCMVLSDRYKFSTFAYQLAQGADLKTLQQLHKGFPVPNLTIIIDITAEEAMKRLGKIGNKKEVFENLEFLTKVRENYLRMKEIFAEENIVVINGMRPKEEVFKEIKKEVHKIL